MEMEQHEVEAVVKKRHAILGRTTLLEKNTKIQTLNNSCGHK